MFNTTCAEVIKVIKFAGNYFENGDIVKVIFMDKALFIGELVICDYGAEIKLKNKDDEDVYVVGLDSGAIFSIEKASEMEVFMWKLNTDNELQKKLAEVTTKQMERKCKIERQIQELQEQL